MTYNFIKLVVAATSFLALSFFIWFWIDQQFFFGLGILIGAAWGCVSVYLIKHLVENLMVRGKKSGWNAFFLLGFKFPLLYSLGYVLLSTNFVSVYPLMYGFSLFLAIIMTIGGAMVFLNKPGREEPVL